MRAHTIQEFPKFQACPNQSA